MQTFVTDNIKMIIIGLIVIAIINILYKVYAYRMKNYLLTYKFVRNFAAFLKYVGPFVVFVSFIYIQERWRLFHIPLEDTLSLMILILTLYGIFYAFLQFAISYTVKNEAEKHWGKSITIFHLTDNVPFTIFRSNLFKLILLYSVIFSFLDIQNPLLINIFNVSIVTIMLLYITLFIRSLSIIGRLVTLQEGKSLSDKIKIEDKLENECYEFFSRANHLRFYPGKLIELVERGDKAEQGTMLIRILEGNVDRHKEMIRKKKKFDTNSWNYAIVFDDILRHDILKNDQFSFRTVLEIYRLREDLIKTRKEVYAKNNDETFLSLMEEFYTKNTYNRKCSYFNVPEIIWEKAVKYEDLMALKEFTDRKMRELWPDGGMGIDRTVLEASLGKFGGSYKNYVGQIIYKLETFENQIKENARYDSNYLTMITDNNMFLQKIYNKIYQYLIENKKEIRYVVYQEILLRALPYEARVSYIFYTLLYPGHDIEKADLQELQIFKRVMNDPREEKDFRDKNVREYILETVCGDNDSVLNHINHRIKPKLIHWVLDHIDTSVINEAYIESCVDSRYLSYLKMLKFTFVFDQKLSPFMNPDVFAKNYMKDAFLSDWRIEFYHEMVEEPSLFQEKYFMEHVLIILQHIPYETLENHFSREIDFRLFLICDKHISEEEFKAMVVNNVSMNDGIIEFFIYHLDDALYDYLHRKDEWLFPFIRRVGYVVDKQSDDVAEYVENLALRLQEIGLAGYIQGRKKRNLVKGLQALLAEE